MKLIAFPLSPFSAKVRIALAAINPRGQVPVLVDGELAIYDSTVIVEYLEDRAPELPLYPKDPASRARCRQLEDAGDELTAGPFVVLVREIWRKDDPAARDAARCHGAAGASSLSRLAHAHGATPERCGRRAAHARRRGANRGAAPMVLDHTTPSICSVCDFSS